MEEKKWKRWSETRKGCQMVNLGMIWRCEGKLGTLVTREGRSGTKENLLLINKISQVQPAPVLCFHNWMWNPRCYLPAAVSELQEEGINAINLPLSPSHYELDPEDTMLGKALLSEFWSDWWRSLVFYTYSYFLLVRGERGAHHGGSQLKEWPQAAGADESRCRLLNQQVEVVLTGNRL